MKQMTMNEVQDLLEDLHAGAHEALTALQENRLMDCRTLIKSLIDELREQIDMEDEG